MIAPLYVEWAGPIQRYRPRRGSNPPLGLNAPQPPNQNCADDNNKQNSKLHFGFTFSLGSKIVPVYNGPFTRLRSMLCLAQCSFPLLSGIVLSPLLRKDAIGDFETAMRCASVAGCVPSTIKLLHCGLADRAKDGPGQRSIPYLMDHPLSLPPARMQRSANPISRTTPAGMRVWTQSRSKYSLFVFGFLTFAPSKECCLCLLPKFGLA